mgnify:FL=1
MHIGERIQKLRKDAGLSQEQLGERLGVSRQAVSKWETGESLPELDKIVQMAEIFGVTTDELLRGAASWESSALGGEERQSGKGEGQRQPPQADPYGFETGFFAPLFRLVKRKGYLAGYYFMGIGALMGVILLGFWFAARSMFGGFMSFGGGFGGLPMMGGMTNSFLTPLKIFVAVGGIIAACVFALGVFIAVRMKKYRN